MLELAFGWLERPLCLCLCVCVCESQLATTEPQPLLNQEGVQYGKWRHRRPFITGEITAAAGGGKVQNSHADKFRGPVLWHGESAGPKTVRLVDGSGSGDGCGIVHIGYRGRK